ncbi:integrase arm-type DNA-binding domain-containing protein [Methylocystis sp. SC2]|jgi:integrase|uniref:tyrosine-type recombinase/integrase n=1 Tax=Methylocystis sp. (strain SC2) TaxID=187303 RepID=UPI00027AE87C|nr:integrase arm-type DNA-binding domain-containing protein [Methylocystis sp. SC2]CCJ07342.1 Phage integrase family protein [Methylocystis sp. SC2]
MPLTDTACRAAKGRASEYKLSDGGGLYLLVKPSGARLWNQAYRFSGKQKKLSHGPYPSVPLVEARRLRDEAKKLLASGVDPGANKKAAKLTAVISATNTFGGVAEEYLQRIEDEGAAASTVTKSRWLLVDLAGPDLGARPIADITPAEILALLQRIERSGRRETARRLRSVVGTVFRLAVSTLRAKDDPTILLRGALMAPKVQHRAAITDEKQLGALLVAIDAYDGWPTLRCALQFTALTFARPGEVRGATWAEINVEEAIWRIDGDRTKVRRPHDVPLSRQALDVLREVKEVARSTLVFPSIRSNARPLSENAMNAALRRMGFTQDEMTAHGFRAAASSILNERGFRPDVIEAALGHQDQNEIRRAYNRASYWQERIELMQAWSDCVDKFKRSP